MSERFPVSAVPDRPEFEVRVDGTALEPVVQRDVVDIEVAEEVNGHGRAVLALQNWNPDTRTVRHSDDGPFQPGAEIEVLVGYHSELTSVFSGVISSLTGHFPSSGPPLLRIEARSRSILLANPPRSRVFEEVSDGDVATSIASEYGLGSDASEGVVHPSVVLHRTTDWQHLRERASELGWVVYVRDSDLVFRPPAALDDPVELTWGQNIRELHITQDLSHVADPVLVTGWDPEGLEAVDTEADEPRAEVETGDRPNHGSALEDAGWPARQGISPTALPLGADETDARASGQARKAALTHYSGKGATIGLPDLRCDSWLRLQDVGTRLSGPHYVSGVRHRVSARGFTTEFQVGAPPRLAPPAPAAAERALLIGVVEALDDPLGWGRVKVAFPWRSDAVEPVWARLATTDAGPEMGTLFIPDVGQEVVVAFLEGDASNPIVLGSLWNGQQAPPLAVEEENAIRAIVTRSGHALHFDDGDGKSVTLKTADDSELVLSDADGSIVLTESASGNSVSLSSDGIVLEAASGDVVLSAPAGKVIMEASGIEGTSTGAAKLESSATLDLKASATLGIQGALVNIN